MAKSTWKCMKKDVNEEVNPSNDTKTHKLTIIGAKTWKCLKRLEISQFSGDLIKIEKLKLRKIEKGR